MSIWGASVVEHRFYSVFRLEEPRPKVDVEQSHMECPESPDAKTGTSRRNAAPVQVSEIIPTASSADTTRLPKPRGEEPPVPAECDT